MVMCPSFDLCYNAKVKMIGKNACKRVKLCLCPLATAGKGDFIRSDQRPVNES